MQRYNRRVLRAAKNLALLIQMAGLVVLAACGQEVPVAETAAPPLEETSVATNHISSQSSDDHSQRKPQDFSRRQNAEIDGDTETSLEKDFTVHYVDNNGNVLSVYPPSRRTPAPDFEVGSNLPTDEQTQDRQGGQRSDVLASINSVASRALSETPTDRSASDAVAEQPVVTTELSSDVPSRDHSLVVADVPADRFMVMSLTPNDTEAREVETAGLTVSDEQDFEAVAQRESIESDARRLSRQRANRVDLVPQKIPERAGSSNVAEYALNSINIVGNKIYERPAPRKVATTLNERCTAFGSAYAAQQAFLDAGGPESDEFYIDPDGDGFACNWTPDIYRSLVN